MNRPRQDHGTGGGGRAVARRRLDGLTPHPEWVALFGHPPDDEFERVAHALRAGQHAGGVLPEVTPDGQVLFGHAAVLAARRAGLEEIEVVVRGDLAGRPDAVIALAVIDAALERGGLAPLNVSRCLKRAHELRADVPHELRPAYLAGELEDQVARRLRISRRNAQRYIRLLRAPPEVQAAYAADHFSLTLAERAAGLSDADQAALAEALRGGEEPRAALARLIDIPTGRHSRAIAAWRAFARQLHRGLDDLDGRVGKILALTPEDAALLDRAIDLLRSLRATTAVMGTADQAARLRGLCQQMGQGQPGPAS